MSAPPGRERTAIWPWRLAIAAGLLAAGTLAFMTWVATAFSCSFDTSYCGKDPDQLEAFQGTITDANGRPVGGARFHLSDETYRGAGPGPVFRSEDDGSYCVLWPTGSTLPFAQPLDPGLRSSMVEPDPTFVPEANDCQTSDRRAPWYRYENLTSTWQHWLLLGLPALTAGLFASAGLLGRSDSRARRLAFTGAALVGLNAVLFVVLWNLV